MGMPEEPTSPYEPDLAGAPGVAGGKKKKKPKADEERETREEMAASYGWALTVLKSNGELWRLFLRAVDKKFSVARFTAELRNTRWFKRHSATWREDYVLKKSDGAEWKRRRDQMIAKMADQATEMGVTVPRKNLEKMAALAMAFQWDDATVRNNIARYLAQAKGGQGYGGEAGRAEEELRQYALDMGVTLSDASVKKWLQAIIAKSGTVEQYKGWIRNQAMQSFAALAAYIKQGQTVRQLAEPYMQSMGEILELNPASLTLRDPTIRSALSAAGKDGKGGMMSLTDFENMLRQDPRWLKTKNARTTLIDIGNGVLKDFGLIG